MPRTRFPSRPEGKSQEAGEYKTTMSTIRVQKPVIHTPTFQKWGIQQYYFLQKVQALGIDVFPKTDDFTLDDWYYYTDLDGWAKILPDLVLNSNLYKPNVFDCEDYGLKAQIECSLRYGINSLRLCIGKVPKGWHGFNIFPYGDDKGIEGLMLFEPNAGFEWAGNAFQIGDNGYIPEAVFLSSRKERR